MGIDWNDLYYILYVTNRPVTVIILAVMFAADVVLFGIMGRFGLRVRMVCGVVIAINFAWIFAWYFEPGRGISLEPILREAFLVGELLVKCIVINLFYHPPTSRTMKATVMRPLSRQERAMGLLMGLGGLSLSTALAIGFWLFSTYRDHEDKEALRARAVKEQTAMVSEFRQILSEFAIRQEVSNYRLDSLLTLAERNHIDISAVKKQGATGIAIAKSAEKEARTVARNLKNKETLERSGKSIPTPKKSNLPKASPGWFEELYQRFNKDALNLRLVPATPLIYSDSVMLVRTANRKHDETTHH